MRGNNREKIFTRKDQKSYFIELLINFKKEPPVEIAAYCVMDNHVHIVIAGEIDDLSEVMKRINIKYAMKFNKEADRIGHVFQDRYGSRSKGGDGTFCLFFFSFQKHCFLFHTGFFPGTLQ